MPYEIFYNSYLVLNSQDKNISFTKTIVSQYIYPSAIK